MPTRKSQEYDENLTEKEGLEPPSLTAAVFKTADLPISLFLLVVVPSGFEPLLPE